MKGHESAHPGGDLGVPRSPHSSPHVEDEERLLPEGTGEVEVWKKVPRLRFRQSVLDYSFGVRAVLVEPLVVEEVMGEHSLAEPRR